MTTPFHRVRSSQTIQGWVSFRNALEVIFAVDLNGSQATPESEISSIS
jgi:hypothetical protein